MEFGDGSEGGDGLERCREPADPEPRSIASLRRRIDGFTPERQRRFLGALVETGCVGDSARVAGVSTTTIDRVRRLFPDFDAKCRAALDLALPNLEAIAYKRATVGAAQKVIRNGRLVEVRIKPSDSILRTLLAGAAPEKYGRFAGLAPAGKAAGGAGAAIGEPDERIEFEDAILMLDKRLESFGAGIMKKEGYTAGPNGELVAPGWRMVREEELKQLGWTLPDGEAKPPALPPQEWPDD